MCSLSGLGKGRIVPPRGAFHIRPEVLASHLSHRLSAAPVPQFPWLVCWLVCFGSNGTCRYPCSGEFKKHTLLFLPSTILLLLTYLHVCHCASFKKSTFAPAAAGENHQQAPKALRAESLAVGGRAVLQLHPDLCSLLGPVFPRRLRRVCLSQAL